MKIKIQILLLAAIFIAGCKKVDESSTLLSANKLATSPPTPIGKSGQINAINVFYFLPKGVDRPLDNHRKRIGSVLNYAQNWFAEQMLANGFQVKYPLFNLSPNLPITPGASVAMFYDAPMANVTVVRGAYGIDRYNSGDGLRLASQEIDAYLQANGMGLNSQHKLVFLPGTGNGQLYNSTGTFGAIKSIASKFVTCSAPDKTAFVLDYDGFYAPGFLESPAVDDNFKYTYGRFIHELAHCLNVGHNTGKPSEASLGTALMSKAELPFSSKLYLTKSDCAILNYCQSLNPNPVTQFYCPYTFNLKNVSLEYSKNTRLITVKGQYNTTIGVAAINYTHLYKQTTIANDKNADYEGVSWVREQNQSAGDVSFTAQMSFDDFIVNGNNTAYQLTISFLLNNGSQVKYKLYYYIDGGMPNFLSGAVPDEPFQLSNSKWTVAGVSSEYAPFSTYNGPAFRIFDGNANTTWAPDTRKMSVYPQEVLIDCNETVTANVFYMSQYTAAISSGGSNFEVQLSNDGINFWVAGNYNSAIGKTPAREYFQLKKNESFRYFKLVMVKSLSPTTPIVKGYNIGEVGFLKK